MPLLALIAPVVVGFVLLAGVFAVVERFWPSIPGQRRPRRGWRADLAWFAWQPTFGKLLSGVIVFVSIMSVGALIMSPISAEELRGITPRETWITALPIAPEEQGPVADLSDRRR